jgi:hypothetical protein
LRVCQFRHFRTKGDTDRLEPPIVADTVSRVEQTRTASVPLAYNREARPMSLLLSIVVNMVADVLFERILGAVRDR